MTMHRLLSLLVLVMLAATAHAGVIRSWNFSDAITAGEIVSVPETAGGPALQFRSGASVAVDPDEGGRRVVVLGGAQADPGRTLGKIEPLPEIQARVRFRPASTGPALQTIVAFGGCYELRYNRERSRIEFIVFYPEKKYFTVHAPVSPDIWNQATATFKDRKLTLAVGMSRAEDVLPPEAAPGHLETTVRIGLVGERAFVGSISEIVLSTP